MIETEDAQGRLKNRAPVGVVDIGSNSVRIVIYEGMVRAPAVLFNEKVSCGLGRGIAQTGRMDEDAVERVVGEVAEARHAGGQRVVRCGETKIGAVDDMGEPHDRPRQREVGTVEAEPARGEQRHASRQAPGEPGRTKM